jgi:hypothetical protein
VKETQYLFKQAVSIRPKGHTPKNFSRGVHAVPEAYEYDAHFLKYVSVGYIAEAPKQPRTVASLEDRNQKLYDSIIARKRKTAPAEPPAEQKPEAKEEPFLDEDSEEKKPGKKKKG